MRDDFSFIHRLRVRWSEVDMQKVVFNGNYFNYFDVAVFEAWQAMVTRGVERQGPGLRTQFDAWVHDIFLVKASAEYHLPAHWNDDLEIGSRVVRLGRSSMRTLVEIHRGDEHLVSGELIYVYKDPVAQAPGPIPDAFRRMIIDFEKVAPEGA